VRRNLIGSIGVWAGLIVSCVLCLPPTAYSEQATAAVPECFVEDTLYYMVMNLDDHEFSLWYGPWELLTCTFTSIDTSAQEAFAERWRSPDRSAWQVVKRRGVWSGTPAVSDTVIRVVSEVSKVDPELIKRIAPDRFRIDLSSDFHLLVLTPEGQEQERGWGEIWNSYAKRISALGRYREVTLVVSSADAQSLYYALEPGTPVLLSSSGAER